MKWFRLNPEILGIFASIGIKKGQPFKPDGRMKKILTEAADIGAVTVRTIMSQPRDDIFYFYPDESVWCNSFPGGNYEWLNEGVRLLDARAGLHFYATGITSAMAKKIIGKGSKYAFAYTDSNPASGFRNKHRTKRGGFGERSFKARTTGGDSKHGQRGSCQIIQGTPAAKSGSEGGDLAGADDDLN